MLHSGERQVAPDLTGIRRDHLARYEWAAKQLDFGDVVIDAGCGVGYGSAVVAEVAGDVYAVDIDADAIAYATANYGRPNIKFGCGDLGGVSFYSPASVGIAFEIIEHLKDPRLMLRSLHASGCQTLFASVPNEVVFPWHRGILFHHRHYTPAQFEDLLKSCGWYVDEWFGQQGTQGEVEAFGAFAEAGPRTLVVVATAGVLPAEEPAPEPMPAGPKHVAIVALGGTAEAYVDHVKRLGNRRAYCDETWAINAMGDVIACDLVFHMDDVRIQEIRAAARPKSNIAAMLAWLKTTRTPVMTSRAHPDYPALIEFPFEDVANALGEVYWNNTVAYAVCYAIYRGVERLSLFGCDYTYTNRGKGEAGRACVEYWLGIASARGIEITTDPRSPLLDSYRCRKDDDVYAYGYDTLQIAYTDDHGRMRFSMSPRDKLPTAEEIEAAYDHDRPPHEQHGRMGLRDDNLNTTQADQA